MADVRIIDANGGTAFEDGADRGRLLISGSQTNGAYSLMEWSVAPGRADSSSGRFGAHRHALIDEVFVVVRGRIEFLLDDVVTTLVAGDVVRVPAGARHGYRNATDTPVDMLVWFSPGGFEELFVRYRSDGTPCDGAGLCSDAAEQFATTFELDDEVSPDSRQ